MKKKELLKEVSQVVNPDSPQEDNVNEVSTKFIKKLFDIHLFDFIFYQVCLGLFFAFLPRYANISFISADFYMWFVIILILLTFILGGLCYTLYIYNKKNNVISLNKLRLLFIFYKIEDVFAFIGKFLAVFLWLLIFVITPVEVSGTSMENTFKNQDKLVVWQFMGEAKQNDVIIIDTSTNYEQLKNVEFIIKRVMATSGDLISYEDHNIYVNGKLAFKDASYEQFANCLTVLSPNGVEYYLESKNEGYVPEGYIVVFGDNRINSYDSKSIGLIHKDDIVGKCIMRIGPIKDFGFIK